MYKSDKHNMDLALLSLRHIDDVTKCGFVSRNILGRRCKPLEARAAGNVAA